MAIVKLGCDHKGRGGFILEGDRIGKGGFGLVRACRRIEKNSYHPVSGGPPLVGKLVFQGNPDGSEKDKRRHEEARREVMILSKCTHPNIAELVDLVVEEGMVLFVMKYEPCGDLHYVLWNTIKRGLFEHEAVYAFRQMLEAVKFLHSHMVVHRDLKHQNLLVASCMQEGDQYKPHIKVTDFGLSKMCGDTRGSTSFHGAMGTLNFMPPEVYHRQHKKQGFAIDIWCLGVLLFYIMTRKYLGNTFDETTSGEPTPCPCLSTQQKINEDITGRLPMLMHAMALGQMHLDPDERLKMRPTEALKELDIRYPGSSGGTMTSRSNSGSGSSGSASSQQQAASGSKEETSRYTHKRSCDSHEEDPRAGEVKRLRQQLEDADSAYAQALQNREIEKNDEAYARELNRREKEKQRIGPEFVDLGKHLMLNMVCPSSLLRGFIDHEVTGFARFLGKAHSCLEKEKKKKKRR